MAENFTLLLILLFSQDSVNINNLETSDIHKAIQGHDIEKFKSIIKASKDVKSKDGHNVVEMIIISGDDKLFDSALNAGVDIHKATTKDESSLHLAARSKSTLILKKIIDNGGDLSKNDASGLCPLSIAICSKKNDNINEILKHKNNGVNRISKIGMKPIHYAAVMGDVKILENLILHGAAISDNTREGENVLDLATRNGNTELIKWVSSHHPEIKLSQSKDIIITD
jgi:ankyrin repeat protein